MKKLDKNGISITAQIQFGEDTRPVAYGLMVFIYGDDKYPFNEIDKESMQAVIGDAVSANLLPGQTGEVYTLSITN